MFKLITNIDHAFKEANAFIFRSMPNFEISEPVVARTLPLAFPSLIDWFVNKDYRDMEMLDGHVCDRSMAKSLIYPKTNKTRCSTWYIAQDAEKIPDIVHRIVLFNENTKLVKTDGFEEVVSELKQGELFLMNARTLIIKRDQRTKAHISIVNRTLAKSLVYYKKDTEKVQDWPKFVMKGKYTFKLYDGSL